MALDPTTLDTTLNEENLAFVEDLYARYLANPAAVDAQWRDVLGALDGRPLGTTLDAGSVFRPGVRAVTQASPAAATLMARVGRLVDAFRRYGHLEAKLDPLGTPHDPRPHPDLALEAYGFTPEELETLVPGDASVSALLPATVRELHARLAETYSGNVGVELDALDEAIERRWLLERIETTRNRRALSRAERFRILERLAAAEGIERFLQAKFVGNKRFSLEGAETLLPLMDRLIENAGELGVVEIALGMPHRGRLNVLVNVLNMDPAQLLAEFQDIDPESTLGAGDVKYHLGASADYETRSGKKVHLSLAFNPSHLEAVDPVVLGRARGKQDRGGDVERARVLPVLLHGDAAFAGQGLVSEILNLAALKGYRTGGTIHIVVNNQIGFTTSPRDSRSTIYCTDVALAAHVPIFHVNGEDPEAVAHVVALAVEYRQTFKKDAVIDMYCYRKYGHNESDEPSFTQPLLYKQIDAHPSPLTVYTRRLIEQGTVAQADVDLIVAETNDVLEGALERARASKVRYKASSLTGAWKGYRGGPDRETPDVDTGVPRERLEAILDRLVTVPPGFTPHAKIKKLLEHRAEARRGAPLDWGLGEALAFGSLLASGTRVRLSGQDSRRGTFSHRHAVLTDVTNGAEHTPLLTLGAGQGDFTVYDSALSEFGVLGFDYGYSLEFPDGLVIWEAQFGDFANGAQVLIDQFISSAEDKWRRLSGIVLLLPHGYEGQGPEHSSARLERWLQLCAEDNMQVVQPTTPAQIFHVLRRQVLRPWRKPLVVLTPKSLLRHPLAVSPLDALAHGRFERVLGDASVPREGVRRVVLCSGKIAYELQTRRERLADRTTAIVRLEQLYPLPVEGLRAALDAYPGATDLVWAQDEPLNMGSWTFLLARWGELAPGRPLPRVVSRVESASPATGSAKAHAIEQERILVQVFGQGVSV